MRTRVFLVAAIILLAICTLFSASCSGGRPKAKTGVQTAYELNLSDCRTIEFSVFDLIDPGKAGDLEYRAATGSEHVNVTEVIDGRFTVTAVSAGSAEVSLSALRTGQVQLTVTLNFTVTEEPVDPDDGDDGDDGDDEGGRPTDPDDEPEPSGLQPLLVAGAKTNFEFDLADVYSARIAIADYIDENGAEEVTYVTAQSNDRVAVSEITDGAFTVTGLETGESAVTLKAVQYNEDIVTVELRFATRDTRPVVYTVTGIANGTGYEMTGAASVIDGNAYLFSVRVLATHYGDPSVAYTVDGQDGEALTGTESPKGTFNFTIAGEWIAGDIVFGAVTGILPRTQVSVGGIANGVDYTMTGAATAKAGTDYSFTITPRFAYSAAPVVSYSIGGTEGEALIPTQSAGVYTYTIAGERLTGAVNINSVAIDDSRIEPNQDSALFDTANWSLSSGSSKAAGLTKTGDVLSFTNTDMGYRLGTGDTHITVEAKLPADLKSSYQWRFGATDNDNSAYHINFDMTSSNVVFMLANGSWIAKTDIHPSVFNGQWTRFDFVMYPQNDEIVWKVYVNGSKVTLVKDTASCPATMDIQNGNLIDLTGTLEPNWMILQTASGKTLSMRPYDAARTFAVSGLSDGTGYTMASPSGATATRGSDYVFTVALKDRYNGTPVLSYQIGTGAERQLAHTSVNSDTYTFTISKDVLLDAVTLSAVTGLTKPFLVSGLSETADFTIQGEAEAAVGRDYTLTVTSKAGNTIPKVQYKIGTGSLKTAVFGGADANAEVFTFRVPASDITDDVTFTVTKAAASGISSTSENAIELMEKTGTYPFATFINTGTGTVRYEAEFLSAGTSTVTVNGSSFSITLDESRSSEVFRLRIWVLVDDVCVFRKDIDISLVNLYSASAWLNVTGDSGKDYTHDTVKMSDGSIMLTASNKRYSGAFSNAIVSGVADNEEYKFAFRLNASNEFTLRFLATDSTARDDSAGNRLDLKYDGAKLIFYPAVGSDKGAFAYARDWETGYKAGEWNVFEFVFQPVNKAVGTQNSISSWSSNSSGSIGVDLYINGKKVVFKIEGNASTGILTFGSGRNFRLLNGTPYIQRLSSSDGSGSRFGRGFIIQTADAEDSVNSVRIAPLSASVKDYKIASAGSAAGTSFFTAGNWSRLSGVTDGLSAPVKSGDELRFNDAGQLGTTVPHSANQHMTFMLKTSSNAQNAFSLRFRASTNNSTYYEIACAYGRFSLRKNNASWLGVAEGAEMLQKDKWNRIDLVLTDTATTKIDFYINRQKVLFVRHSATTSNMDFTDGSIIDKTNVLKGSVFGLITSGAKVQLTPYRAPAGSNQKFTQADFLKVSGQSIRKNKGSGETQRLRGVNAGAYLLIETYMTPFNSNSHKHNTNTFTSRFGKDRTVALWENYRNSYWTEQDFQNCADMGFTAIRLPFWYMTVDPAYNNVKAVSGQTYNFEVLDWFINTAEKYGIYTILDLHGAYGSQNGKDHSGETLSYKDVDFFEESGLANRQKTVDLWKAVAARYKGNPAVAAYDLLNEPAPITSTGGMGTTGQKQWDFYHWLYKEVRAVDPDHIIMFETCWTASNIPKPTQYNWTNCVYQFHNYPSDRDSQSGIVTSMTNKVKNGDNSGHNVPYYMGEFNCYGIEGAWVDTIAMMNEKGWHWTSWSYKMNESKSDRSGWGIYFTKAGSINAGSDSYDGIMNKMDKLRTQDKDSYAYAFSSQRALFDVMRDGCPK